MKDCRLIIRFLLIWCKKIKSCANNKIGSPASRTLPNICFQNLKEFKNKHISSRILKNMTKSQDFLFVFFTQIESNTSSANRIRYFLPDEDFRVPGLYLNWPLQRRLCSSRPIHGLKSRQIPTDYGGKNRRA